VKKCLDDTISSLFKWSDTILANAVVNQVMGKGFESYRKCEVRFCGIENIHVMRESQNKLRKACRTSDPDKRAARIQASGWLKHVQTVLIAAVDIVNEMVFNNSSVVIHCSDGWDRTTQLCSLAELIMDPYYRTIEGFEVLIEKEWLSFGHKFDQRIGHTNQNYKDDQRSPIFLQWLDCVWQIQNQFPEAFEFTPNFLHILYSHVISCCFGTFLFNSETERMQARIRSKTISLWSHMNFHIDGFKRKNFTPVSGTLCTKLDEPKFWKEEYLYWYHYHEGNK